jgi:DNA repair photolyase
MILSVSRRTDIPAFYSEWFYNRIKEGYVLVRNPFNPKQVSRILLSPGVIDCIVFWSKNPGRFKDKLDLLKDYKYYFQFTLNSYDKTVETFVPDKKELISTFIELSGKIGKERVIWRYDPILLTNKFNKEYHYKWFEYLAERLHNFTNKCIISFMDFYAKTERNTKELGILPFSADDMLEMAEQLSLIAQKYNLALETCSEAMDFSAFNIGHSRCIDDRLISAITGKLFRFDKDSNQRENCGCVKSIDIGVYNTCRHNCLYCYANFSKNAVQKNCLRYNPDLPLLLGKLNGDEVIKDIVR